MRVFAFVLCLSCIASSARSQYVTFMPLGDVPGGLVGSWARDASDDGTYVAAYSYTSNGVEAVRWSKHLGFELLGDLTGGSFQSIPGGMSSSSQYIVGGSASTNGYEAFLWSADTGMIGLGDFPGGSFSSIASDVSSNGVVVGQGTYDTNRSQAYRWTQDTGMIGLGFLPSGDRKASEANDVSDDGSVVVGASTSLNTGERAGSEAFIWTQATGMLGLGDLPGGDFNSKAYAVSSNGLHVVGTSDSAVSREPFLWSQATGMVGLLSNGFEYGQAYDLSDDGRVVVGTGNRDREQPFVWTPERGMIAIKDLLLEHGIDLDALGFVLEGASGVSDDGRTIVGTGINSITHRPEGWIVTIPSPSITSILMFAPALICDRRRSSRRAR